MKGLKRWLGVLGALSGSLGFILMGLERLVVLAGILIVTGWVTFAFMIENPKEKVLVDKKQAY